jgi:hypothetical protein
MEKSDCLAPASTGSKMPKVKEYESEGWLEAAIAWNVCASIHSKYAKGKDAFFTTRQADFVRHAEESSAKAKTKAKVPEVKQPKTDSAKDIALREALSTLRAYAWNDGQCARAVAMIEAAL